MSQLLIALTIFATTIVAALAGMVLRVKLPDEHLDGDSKDVVKLVIGLVATMAALVLGLLIASAQTTYSTQSGNVQQLAADVAQLNHILRPPMRSAFLPPMLPDSCSHCHPTLGNSCSIIRAPR